jgi:hypothetical protein
MDDRMVAVQLKCEHAIELFVVLNRHAEHSRPTHCGNGPHAKKAIGRVLEQGLDNSAECQSLFRRSLLNRVENLLSYAKLPDRFARVRPHAAKYPLQADAFGELLQRHGL